MLWSELARAEQTGVERCGNSGLGFATAKRFVEEGAFVFITGVVKTNWTRRAAIGRNVVAVQGDVQNLVDLDRLYAQISAEKGAIDIVVANYGIVDPQALPDTTEESFDKVFNVHVK